MDHLVYLQRNFLSRMKTASLTDELHEIVDGEGASGVVSWTSEEIDGSSVSICDINNVSSSLLNIV